MANLIPSAGSVLMVGLPGPGLDPRTERRLHDLEPAGVILFSRNLESAGQTAALLAEARRLLPGPPLVALDQEGGRVSRLEPWIGATPSAVTLAAAGADSVRRFAAATGRLLAALGFNLDFAPVVDLCGPETPNGIGDRSFGIDAERVTELAGEYLDGLQATGVAGCLKHFPGLGDTRVDSHVVLPTVERTRKRLEAEDLLPYRRLASRAASVMVGHGHYPALDPGDERPASCSKRVVDGLLRRRIGFSGLVVSDDLEMGAVSRRDRDGAAAVESLVAGCDLLLYCADLDRAEAAAGAIRAAAERDEATATRLAAAAEAVRRTVRRWAGAAPTGGEWDSARAEMAEFTALT